jgi:elongator complex protein 3
MEIGEPHLTRMDYEASEGREIFLSFEDERETLFGLLRLRIQPAAASASEATNINSAIVRELHIFGPQVPITAQIAEAAQHKGLGRALLREAERIAAGQFHAQRLVVLSGVGAREYYRQCGYRSAGHYMAKELPVPASVEKG